MKNLKKCIALVLIFALGMMGTISYADSTSFNVRIDDDSYGVLKSGTKKNNSPQGTLVTILSCGSSISAYSTVIVKLYRSGSAVSYSQQVDVKDGEATVSPHTDLYAGDYLSLYGKIAGYVAPNLTVQVTGEVDFQ